MFCGENIGAFFVRKFVAQNKIVPKFDLQTRHLGHFDISGMLFAYLRSLYLFLVTLWNACLLQPSMHAQHRPFYTADSLCIAAASARFGWAISIALFQASRSFPSSVHLAMRNRLARHANLTINNITSST